MNILYVYGRNSKLHTFTGIVLGEYIRCRSIHARCRAISVWI